mmetsp:Transcript_63037/g.133053  ORF Transcript_63037/g.133053 Transcript_63037/m.133053 type:complete len:521 (-) Transcript_63037:88-1650(-)
MVSQGVGGHEGYSGTPLWKIQQQNAAQREAALQESLAYAAERTKPILPPNVLADAVSIGGPSGRPFVRHVLVKCLRKVAQNSRVELPISGVFANQAPMGLYCLFDGQSAASEPGPNAAEYCARNFYKKVLDNLSSLPAGATSETFVKAALVKSFEDMDRDILDTQPDIQDGCGASIALVIGEYLFTAVLGLCDGALVQVEKTALQGSALGKSQGRPNLAEERTRLMKFGGTVVGEGPTAKVICSIGTSMVSRSLGDRAWKSTGAGPSVLGTVPEIHSTKLSWADRHPYVLLVSKPLAEAFSAQQMVDFTSDFSAQPRAACGEIVAKGFENGLTQETQSTAIQVWFLRGGPMGADDASGSTAGEAPRKKPRLGSAPTGPGGDIKSARLRHILIRYQDGPRQANVPKGEVVRSRPEAEALLRQLLRELKVELDGLRRKFGRTKKAEDLWLHSTLFLKLCKEHSICPTSQKGGGMCGDMGWVSREAQRKMSKEFEAAVSVLRPGEWSDIVPSADGLHIVQRIA